MKRKGGEKQEAERWGKGVGGEGAQGADREMVRALMETKRQRQRLII